MKRIISSLELNQYYKIVDSYLIEYINTHKVNAHELYNYVENNLEEFIDECGLIGVFGAKTIIMDVISHILNRDLDLVTTFESFKTKFM